MNYQTLSEDLIPVLELALSDRGLVKPREYVLSTSPAGNTWLFAVLAHNHQTAAGLGKLETYVDPKTLHQISTYLGGKHVALSNSSGLRFGVLLSPKPELPEMVKFPGFNPDRILLGQALTGEVSLNWARFGHWAIGGMTDYGKSNLLSLVALQAFQKGAEIAVLDMQNRTLPQLKYSPSKLFYASDEETCLEGIDLLWGEYKKREKLFSKLEPAFFPGNIFAYNHHTGENLPMQIAFIEEYVELRQALSEESIRKLESLSRLSRKYGIHLVLAGQDWSKEETGAIKSQCHVKLSVRMNDHYQSRMLLGFSGAENLEKPGRALSNQFGAVPFQAYFVDEEEVGKRLMGQDARKLEHISQNKSPRVNVLQNIENNPVLPSGNTVENTSENRQEQSQEQDRVILEQLENLTEHGKIALMIKLGLSNNAIYQVLGGNKQARFRQINAIR